LQESRRLYNVIANSSRMPGNLPSRPTRFIGHADEVARLALTLDDNPVVTVTGAGGVGKTRVAIELAKRTAGYFPDGVWFVNLALLDDGADVVPFVCETLRDVAPLARDAESFAAALGERRLLLLFDSCEHVLDQTAELVGSIVERAPRTRIIATSRQPMGLPREAEHRLGTLAADDAVELFYDRARNAGVSLGDFERPVIATIVQSLDAIPLAIELAAPQLRTMPAEDLLRHLDDRPAADARGDARLEPSSAQRERPKALPAFGHFRRWLHAGSGDARLRGRSLQRSASERIARRAGGKVTRRQRDDRRPHAVSHARDHPRVRARVPAAIERVR
jgi:predicted ATPase